MPGVPRSRNLATTDLSATHKSKYLTFCLPVVKSLYMGIFLELRNEYYNSLLDGGISNGKVDGKLHHKFICL